MAEPARWAAAMLWEHLVVRAHINRGKDVEAQRRATEVAAATMGRTHGKPEPKEDIEALLV